MRSFILWNMRSNRKLKLNIDFLLATVSMFLIFGMNFSLAIGTDGAAALWKDQMNGIELRVSAYNVGL